MLVRFLLVGVLCKDSRASTYRLPCPRVASDDMASTRGTCVCLRRCLDCVPLPSALFQNHARHPPLALFASYTCTTWLSRADCSDTWRLPAVFCARNRTRRPPTASKSLYRRSPRLGDSSHPLDLGTFGPAPRTSSKPKQTFLGHGRSADSKVGGKRMVKFCQELIRALGLSDEVKPYVTSRRRVVGD